MLIAEFSSSACSPTIENPDTPNTCTEEVGKMEISGICEGLHCKLREEFKPLAEIYLKIKKLLNKKDDNEKDPDISKKLEDIEKKLEDIAKKLCLNFEADEAHLKKLCEEARANDEQAYIDYPPRFPVKKESPEQEYVDFYEELVVPKKRPNNKRPAQPPIHRSLSFLPSSLSFVISEAPSPKFFNQVPNLVPSINPNYIRI